MSKCVQYVVYALVYSLFLIWPMSVTATPPADTVLYDQQAAILNKTFSSQVTFDRKQSYRFNGASVVALPGKGKHWMNVNVPLPVNANISVVLTPKQTHIKGTVEVRVTIGRCTFTLHEYRFDDIPLIIEKRGETISFNGMETEQCGVSPLQIMTLPNSRVYEIQDLVITQQ